MYLLSNYWNSMCVHFHAITIVISLVISAINIRSSSYKLLNYLSDFDTDIAKILSKPYM